MISIAKTAKIFVGVDVSKATLDVYRPDTKELFKIENSEGAIIQLCAQLEKKKRQVRVVMEGTGGYEHLLLRCLASHKLEAAVINPRRVRDFAKGSDWMRKLIQSMLKSSLGTLKLSNLSQWLPSQIMS